MSYNGWSSYETWLVNIWYGDYLRDVADEDGPLDNEQIQDMVESMLADSGELPETGLAADFMNAALGNVNWYELAEHINPEPEEDEDEEYDGMGNRLDGAGAYA